MNYLYPFRNPDEFLNDPDLGSNLKLGTAVPKE